MFRRILPGSVLAALRAMNEKDRLFLEFAASPTRLAVRYPSAWDEIKPLLEVFREMEEERRRGQWLMMCEDLQD